MDTLELHPLCTLFPRIAGAEFEALKADILANGLRQPIVVLDGMILDGGNRYAACIAVGIDPDIVEFEGGSPVAFVLSSNLHRRHLSAGQQAAIVASAQDWTKAQAVGKPKSGHVTGLETVAGRALQSGASDKTQRRADKVAKASPELARQVAHGEMSLPQALKKISPPKLEVVQEPEDHGPDTEWSESEDRMFEEMERADQEKREALIVIAESDDKLAAALDLIDTQAKEIGRLNADLRVVTEARDGHMNGKNEAIRMVKSLQRKLAEKEKAAA
jgi:hypothetical protein